MHLMLKSDTKNSMAWHLPLKQMAQSNLSQRKRARRCLTKGTNLNTIKYSWIWAKTSQKHFPILTLIASCLLLLINNFNLDAIFL